MDTHAHAQTLLVICFCTHFKKQTLLTYSCIRLFHERSASGIPDLLHCLDLFTGVVGFITAIFLSFYTDVTLLSVCLVSLLSVRFLPFHLQLFLMPLALSWNRKKMCALWFLDGELTGDFKYEAAFKHSIILFPFKYTTLVLDIF